MLSIKGIYDGKNLELLDKVEVNKPRKVIVTFLDEDEADITNDELLYVAEKGKAFDFLNDMDEDIYTDKDLKIKYK